MLQALKVPLFYPKKKNENSTRMTISIFFFFFGGGGGGGGGVGGGHPIPKPRARELARRLPVNKSNFMNCNPLPFLHPALSLQSTASVLLYEIFFSS